MGGRKKRTRGSGGIARGGEWGNEINISIERKIMRRTLANQKQG